jgi:pimeloyl-ACP methyl ester carboxylesterase
VRIEAVTPVTIEGQTGAYSLAARIVAPPIETPPSRPLVFFCFPGGSFAKEYYDMAGDFSFAGAMAARGHVCVLIDNLGVGASSRPADGYLLHPDVVADANVQAVRDIGARLAQGALGYPALSDLTSIGVGHSMGGMLTGIAQARRQPFAAVAILGSAPFGHSGILPEPLRPIADDPARARREIVERMRAAGLPAYVEAQDVAQRHLLFADVPEPGLTAMASTQTRLIRVCGLFSVVPKSWAPDAAQIKTPVFIAFGDRDLRTDLTGLGDFFSGASSLRQLILADTGHMHFAYPSRAQLFDAVGAWAEALRP